MTNPAEPAYLQQRWVRETNSGGVAIGTNEEDPVTHPTDTVTIDGRTRARRQRRRLWASPVVAACDAELGVIVEWRGGDAASR